MTTIDADKQLTNDITAGEIRFWMFDLDGEPFLVASTLLGVLAQRLVRKVCKDCGADAHLMHAQLKMLNIRTKSGKPLKVLKGKGCHKCRYTGLKGRTGIFELLEVDEAIRKLIAAKEDSVAIKQALRQKGMETLKECGIRKMMAGETTFEEVIRVCAG